MKTVSISVRNLVEFILRSGDIDERRGQGGSVDAMLEGARIHRTIQSAAGSDYTAEVPLKETINLNDEISLTVEGRADGIIDNRGYITVDEIKGMFIDVLKLTEPFPVHLAQAKCYAYIWAKQHDLADISIRMTYVGIEDRHIKLFNSDHTFDELDKWFGGLIESYRPWAMHIAQWADIRSASIKDLDFPYEYRPGQKELAENVYKTIYHGKKLFLEAPTGTGKTLATLYPSVKAMGEGLASYIFYLTAKNIGAKAAGDALELMRKRGGLRLKSVNIIGRDRACLSASRHCNPDECSFAKGHFDRVNDALFELLTGSDSFTREEIERQALKYEVCPYALARDLTEFADCIICDYNYVFDPSVALKQFFGEGKRAGDYIFLVDEAHNLVERAREMFSAELSLRQLGKMRLLIRGIDRRLSTYMTRLIAQMETLAEEYEGTGLKYSVLQDVDGVWEAASRLAGRFLELMQKKSDTEPDKVKDGAGKTIADSHPSVSGGELAEKVPQKQNERFSDEVLEFYFQLAGFVAICDRVDQRYRIYTEMTESRDIRLRLLCVDPSHNLEEYLSCGRAGIFFSATLLPVTYYMDLIAGNRNAYTIYARSVFDPDRLGVFIDTAVTSRYKRRNQEEYRKIAEHIRGIVDCRQGNYLVFFPSYAFLEAVHNEYEGECICQSAEMSETEREDFLKTFGYGLTEEAEEEEWDTEKKNVTGFCVLGGLFAEGIDLTGEKLIGVIIIGTGLPQISNEKDILKKYFDDNGRDGYDYAMKIPGMNKVLQAAGRVIRTEKDTGVIALLDERFDNPDHRRMYPREWQNITKITGCEFNSVSEFWKRHKKPESD